MSNDPKNPKPTKRAVQESLIKELVEEYDRLINTLAEPLEPITISFKGHGADETLTGITIQQLPSGDFRGITRRVSIDPYGVPKCYVAFTNAGRFVDVLCAINQCLAHDSFTWRDDRFGKQQRSMPSHIRTII